MIKALLFRNLRHHFSLMAALFAGLVLFELIIVWVAARIDVGPGFRQLLGALLPPEVVETILGQFGFTSFSGALSFGYQHPLALVAAVALVVVMATIPAQERESGLLDLLLARPLTRTRYLFAVAGGVVTAALLGPGALLAGEAVGLEIVDAPVGVAWTSYLGSAVALVLLLLAVGAYSLLVATSAWRRGVAVAQAVGLTLLFYWLDFMGDYWNVLETARRLSPFHYFDPALAARSGVPLLHWAVLGSVTVLAGAGAFLNFRRQDL